MKKRIIGLFLTVLICLSVAFQAFAEETKQYCPTCTAEGVSNENLTQLGSGDTLRWQCDKGHSFTTPGTTPPGGGTGDSGAEKPDGMKDFITGMLGVVFGNAIVVSDGDVGNALDPWTLLKNSTEVVFKTLDEIVSGSLYTVFKALGIVLLTIYFIMDLATHDTFTAFGNKPTIEQILKPFMKYLLCVLFICNVQWIMYFLLGLSQGAFNQSIQTLTLSNVEMSADIVEKVLAAAGYVTSNVGPLDVLFNLGRALAIIFSFLLPWIVSVVCNALLIYVILSRIVQIVVQGITAPIAMSDIYSDGKFRETRAWGFIRNFAGLCFQSVVIVLILYVVNSLIGTYAAQILGDLGSSVKLGDWSTLAVQMTILKVVQVGTVMSSAAEAKKLFSGS